MTAAAGTSHPFHPHPAANDEKPRDEAALAAIESDETRDEATARGTTEVGTTDVGTTKGRLACGRISPSLRKAVAIESHTRGLGSSDARSFNAEEAIRSNSATSAEHAAQVFR